MPVQPIARPNVFADDEFGALHTNIVVVGTADTEAGAEPGIDIAAQRNSPGRQDIGRRGGHRRFLDAAVDAQRAAEAVLSVPVEDGAYVPGDRKSTRLNSSH